MKRNYIVESGVPYVLTRIQGRTYYLPGPINLGVYLYPEGGSAVIDTGLDEGSARKLLKALREADALPLRHIINTHSHADHCGGNAFLQKRTEALTWASAQEAAIIENPYFEPFYLFSGDPFPALKNKFLMAQPSRVDRILTEEPEELAPLKIIPLPGHAPAQVGVLTPDRVLFCADAFFPAATLDKYYLPYYAQVGPALETLDKLRSFPADHYLPCHGDLAEDTRPLLAANKERLEAVSEYILSLLAEPQSREELVARVVLEKGIEENPAQYFLSTAAIASHLSYLVEKKLVTFTFAGGRMLWSRA